LNEIRKNTPLTFPKEKAMTEIIDFMVDELVDKSFGRRGACWQGALQWADALGWIY
jgi:hypothetical protein